MKIITYLLLFLLLSMSVFAGTKDNTGVDSIFQEVGLEKPLEWSSWNKNQKFSYLQQRGIYPENGQHYEGEANIEGFFVWLGVEKPSNWDSLTFEERTLFVEKVQFPEEFAEIKEETSNSPSLFTSIPVIICLSIIIASFLKPKSKFKKIVQEGIYYALPLILLALSLLYPQRTFFAELGGWAEKLLIFLLFIKPLSVIFAWRPLRRAVAYRRESGIASFWFFIFHAGGLMYTRNLITLSEYTTPYLFWGSVAGLGMIILAATSNNESVRYFKRNWKKIQYIVYPTFLGVLAHSSLWEHDNLNKFFLLGGIFILLKVGEYVKLKSNKRKRLKK